MRESLPAEYAYSGLMGFAMSDSLRKVLGDNLTRLMQQSTRGLTSTLQVEKATEVAGMKIGKSTVDRMMKGSTPVNLDYVEVLSKVMGVKPWQLLVPDLAPRNLPRLAELGDTQAELLTDLKVLANRIAELDSAPKAGTPVPLRRKLPR